MKQYRLKAVVIEAVQWFKNGDHPEDGSVMIPMMGDGDDFLSEGKVVRRYRHPCISGDRECIHCGKVMHDHGWINTLEGGHKVCPGDWIIKGVKGEFYPCKPEIFAMTYEAVGGEAKTPDLTAFLKNRIAQAFRIIESGSVVSSLAQTNPFDEMSLEEIRGMKRAYSEVLSFRELSGEPPNLDMGKSEADRLRSVMIAAAEEIQLHWKAHCDEEGYGPANLMHRLENGIDAYYPGYNAGSFTKMELEIEQLQAKIKDLTGGSAPTPSDERPKGVRIAIGTKVPYNVMFDRYDFEVIAYSEEWNKYQLQWPVGKGSFWVDADEIEK